MGGGDSASAVRPVYPVITDYTSMVLVSEKPYLDIGETIDVYYNVTPDIGPWAFHCKFCLATSVIFVHFCDRRLISFF